MQASSRRGVPEWLIAACGVWHIGLGLYFIFLRPALLPEDLRYIGVNPGQPTASRVQVDTASQAPAQQLPCACFPSSKCQGPFPCSQLDRAGRTVARS